MSTLNETHDPALTSWLASANVAGTDFPIQNLPFAVFRRQGTSEAFRGGVAIGDQIIDILNMREGSMIIGLIDGWLRSKVTYRGTKTVPARGK